MNNSQVTPIAVFAYNRATHLRLTLEALARCVRFAECELFVFCDAGKEVEQTRQTAHDFVKRHGGTVIERPEPMGYRNIVDGITEMCDLFGRVIVVEDDIIVSPDFIDFMLQSLDRYANDEQAFMVSGYMYAVDLPPAPSTFFLPVTLIWGWATWQRAWKHFEWDPKDWRAMLDDPEERERFDFGGTRPFSDNLEKALTGKLESWAMRWAFAMYRYGGLGLYPHRSLTWNCGVGGGVHGFGGLGGRHIIDHRVDFMHGNDTRDDYLVPRLDAAVLPDRVAIEESQMNRLIERLRMAKATHRRVCRMAIRMLDLFRATLCGVISPGKQRP